jgi:hypothetical protein
MISIQMNQLTAAAFILRPLVLSSFTIYNLTFSSIPSNTKRAPLGYPFFCSITV